MPVMGAARIKMDPRMVQKIQRSPTMMAEQGPDWLQSYGGPSTYRTLARLPFNERVVYLSILGGSKSAEDVNLDTGGRVTVDQAQKALDSLVGRGLVA